MTDEDKGWLATYDLLAHAGLCWPRTKKEWGGFDENTNDGGELNPIVSAEWKKRIHMYGKINSSSRQLVMNDTAIAFAKHYCESKND